MDHLPLKRLCGIHNFVSFLCLDIEGLGTVVPVQIMQTYHKGEQHLQWLLHKP